MSAKGRSAAGYVPDPNGFFQTQSRVVRAIMPFLGIKPGMRILEPSCGNGAIAKVIREVWGGTVCIIGIEIDKKRAAAALKAKAVLDGSIDDRVSVFDQVIHADFFKCDPAAYLPVDLIVTNPSFSIWLPFADHCFKHGAPTTLLLPLNAIASKQRSNWWREKPAHLRVLSKRPSFAISVKCVASTGAGRKLGLAWCEFQRLIALDARVPALCPDCGEKIVTTRSDSSEYSWVTWSPDITRGLWDVINTPEEEAPKKKATP